MRSFMPRSASRIMRASKPAPAMTANRSPLTFPRSSSRWRPCSPIRTASAMSLGIPRFVARRLAVPAGMIATTASVPASASTVRCTIPSPPHTKTRSAPSSTTRRASFGARLLFGTSCQIGSVDALVGENVSAALRGRRRATCGRARSPRPSSSALPERCVPGCRRARPARPRRARRAATRASARKPSRTPAPTSVGKCMPRYRRETQHDARHDCGHDPGDDAHARGCARAS